MRLDPKTCHPDIDDVMQGRIDTVIETHKDTPGAAITVLRECQDIAGYLPVELMDYIADGMNLPRSEIFGTASFYALFSMTPKGRHTIKVCTGTACYVKGIREVVSRIESEYHLREGQTTEDRRFSFECVRCLGACGLAPVMMVGKDTHGDVAAEKVIRILENYR